MSALVAREPQGYQVVQHIAFRYRDLKEGRDVHFPPIYTFHYRLDGQIKALGSIRA